VKPCEVIRLYDREYAVSSERKFLEASPNELDTRHEVELIRSLLAPSARWLDAVGGTGYFLSRFPEVERAGLAVSPAMLELAHERNPGIELRRHDFREPLPSGTIASTSFRARGTPTTSSTASMKSRR
jgi:hypothetical protein